MESRTGVQVHGICGGRTEEKGGGEGSRMVQGKELGEDVLSTEV